MSPVNITCGLHYQHHLNGLSIAIHIIYICHLWDKKIPDVSSHSDPGKQTNACNHSVYIMLGIWGQWQPTYHPDQRLHSATGYSKTPNLSFPLSDLMEKRQIQGPV